MPIVGNSIRATAIRAIDHRPVLISRTLLFRASANHGEFVTRQEGLCAIFGGVRVRNCATG